MTAYRFAFPLGYGIEATLGMRIYLNEVTEDVNAERAGYLIPIGAPMGKSGESDFLASRLARRLVGFTPTIIRDDHSYTAIENIQRIDVILRDQVPSEDWYDLDVPIQITIYCEQNRYWKVRVLSALILDSRVVVRIYPIEFEFGLKSKIKQAISFFLELGAYFNPSWVGKKLHDYGMRRAKSVQEVACP